MTEGKRKQRETKKYTREQLSSFIYLTRPQIRKLLLTSKTRTDDIYKTACELDEKELGNMRKEDRAVRITSVSKASGVSLKIIIEQAKGGRV